MQCAGQSSNAPRDWNPESYCDEMPGEPPLEWTLALFCLQGSFITVRELFGANLLDNLLSRSSSVEFHSLIVFFFLHILSYFFFLSFLAPHSTFSSPRKRPAIHSFDAKGSIVKNFSPDLGVKNGTRRCLLTGSSAVYVTMVTRDSQIPCSKTKGKKKVHKRFVSNCSLVPYHQPLEIQLYKNKGGGAESLWTTQPSWVV